MSWLRRRPQWIKNGPKGMPPRYLPYWRRVLELMPAKKLRESDGPALMLLSGALRDSERGLDDEAENESAMINARRQARKEYANGLAGFMEALAGREELAEKRSRKSKKSVEDFLDD